MTANLNKGYDIVCLGCHSSLSYRGYALRCKCGDALLRTVYHKKRLESTSDDNIWKFGQWLPTNGKLNTCGRSITYKSVGLSKELGLKELYISFNGYWPEKNAHFETCSFKELESPPTVQRAFENGINALVISSVGNTARAFAHTVTTSQASLKLILIGLESSSDKLWLPEKPSNNVKLIYLKAGNDYSDAIALGERLSQADGLSPEGGARNVARRDGMGTVMLEAALTIGRTPKYYFQAIGSGAGGIAAWEASLRLRDSGQFVKARLPQLHLSQNRPFVPMYNAWKAGRRFIVPSIDMKHAKENIAKIYADVLSNRNPAYSMKGGVYDALQNTLGEMYAVTNDEAIAMSSLFEDLEGIDIVPAAAVATASLLQAVEHQSIGADEVVLLNITGGGEKRLTEDKQRYTIEPQLIVDNPQVALEEILEVIT